MRFERVNDASWSLLYLDPACQAQLGLAACELCGLHDKSYLKRLAGVQPEHLHREIQLQLLQSAHYQVQYQLQTPAAVLTIVERGEVFKQHGHELIRGYLAINAVASSNKAGNGVHPARLRAQQNLILHLAQYQYRSTDSVSEAAELISKAAADIYEVERASIWMLGSTGLLEPLALYSRKNQCHQPATALDIKAFPNYLSALHSGRAIDAHDALRDPRTTELRDSYLQPLQIGAMLDASIRVDGEVVALLCLEHTGTQRVWQNDEVAFAGELADQFGHVLINQQRRSAASALHVYRRAVEQSSSGFILINSAGLVEYINSSFSAITLFSEDEVCNKHLSELAALFDFDAMLSEARASLAKHNSWQGELKTRRKNKEPYWGHLSISKVLDDAGQITHYIGIYEDISESKLTLQRIEKLAYTDSVTKTGNRAFLLRSLDERLGEPSAVPRSLLMVDIDNFKRINDSLGHQIGDKLLSSLARRLTNSLAPGATLARFASNEFGILLDGVDLVAAQRTAHMLLSTLDKPLFVDGQLFNITASIGLACAPEHGRDPKTLLQNAGLALHKAKANGKHQLQVFTTVMNAEASFKHFLEINLRRALAQDELEVYYQPKLCLRSGRLLGMEALLRWNHPEQGMISPDHFISVAEETGLILPIGKWLLREACRQVHRLDAAGLPPLKVAVNLSPRQFSDPDLVGAIREILEDENLPCNRMELELTESLLLDATESTRQQLIELKSLGLSLAMDDFGTGYSSLSYLKKFPIDVIKVDRSFVMDIPANQDDMEIVSAVIAMAHKLNIKVVAEGIESSAQLAFLRKQNCDIGQGYLFDRPIAGRLLAERLHSYVTRH